jgi:hypothetical protein
MVKQAAIGRVHSSATPGSPFLYVAVTSDITGPPPPNHVPILRVFATSSLNYPFVHQGQMDTSSLSIGAFGWEFAFTHHVDDNQPRLVADNFDFWVVQNLQDLQSGNVAVVAVTRRRARLTGGIFGAALHTVPPCRIADTRDPTGPYGGPALSGGSLRTFAIAGRCGVPSTATSIAANVTVDQGTSAGELLAFPAHLAAPPLASTISYKLGQTRADNAIVNLDQAGNMKIWAAQPPGTAVHVILDVNGYFQ